MILVQVNPIESFVMGVPNNGPVERALMEMSAYFKPGYEKNMDYITRKWDGRAFLFRRSPTGGHIVPTGLLSRLYTVLNKMNVPCEAFDNLRTPESDPGFANVKNIGLRDYQLPCTLSMLTPRHHERIGGVLQAATGAGKTRVAAKMMQLMKMQTLFLVNQNILVKQAKASFESLLGMEIGQIGDSVCDPKTITVATIQSIARAYGLITPKVDMCGEEVDDLNELNLKKQEKEEVREARHLVMRNTVENAKLVIFDEVHGVAARTPYAVLQNCRSAIAIGGLSASPWRDDGLDIMIEAACGPVVHVVTATELIQQGWLVPVDINVHRMPEPMHYHPGMYSDRFDQVYRAWVVENEPRNEYVANLAYDHMAKGEVTIILVKQIDHGKDLEDRILHSVFLNGKITSEKKREKMLDSVKNGEVKVLIGTSLADQGLDIPLATAVILAGGGKSSTRALQRIGRVLRTEDGERLHPGHTKQRAYVHDIVDAQRALRDHYYERLRIYKTEPAFRIVEKRV